MTSTEALPSQTHLLPRKISADNTSCVDRTSLAHSSQVILGMQCAFTLVWRGPAMRRRKGVVARRRISRRNCMVCWEWERRDTRERMGMESGCSIWTSLTLQSMHIIACVPFHTHYIYTGKQAQGINTSTSHANSDSYTHPSTNAHTLVLSNNVCVIPHSRQMRVCLSWRVGLGGTPTQWRET